MSNRALTVMLCTKNHFLMYAGGKLIYDSIAFSLCFDRLQMNT